MLEIQGERNNLVGIGNDYGDIGIGLKELNKRKEALESFEKGLHILLEFERQTGYRHPLMETHKKIRE